MLSSSLSAQEDLDLDATSPGSASPMKQTEELLDSKIVFLSPSSPKEVSNPHGPNASLQGVTNLDPLVSSPVLDSPTISLQDKKIVGSCSMGSALIFILTYNNIRQVCKQR